MAGDSVVAWSELHGALLSESADGEIGQAAAEYQRIVRNAAAGDPLRTEALYWLGRARYSEGDVKGARDALREGVRTGVNRGRCLDLLDQIELDQNGIRKTPLEWNFDDPSHAFLHPWFYRDKGSIRITTAPRSGPALAWETDVDKRTDDQLWLSFREPTPTARGVRFIAWSDSFEAHLRILALDDGGRQYRVPGNKTAMRVATGKPLQIDVRLDQMVSDDAEAMPLQPQHLARIIIQDATTFYSRATGPNRIVIDDFEVY